jgi:hypothetical protein
MISRLTRVVTSSRNLRGIVDTTRFFSLSSSSTPTPPPSSWRAATAAKIAKTIAAQVNENGTTVAVGVGGLVIVYGMSTLAFHATSTFLSLTLTDAMYFGFGTGFVSAAMLAGGAARAYVLATLSPDAAYAVALARIRADERVALAMGASLSPGELKAYTHVQGHLSTTKLGWVDPRVSMLFQVVGNDTGRQAMASVEAIKHKGVLSLTLLALDILPAPGSRTPQMLLIEGKEERLHVRGQLRGFLQSERAQFIAQDETETDEALLAEQAEAERAIDKAKADAEAIKMAQQQEQAKTMQ